jgi:hypothetical protein
MVVSLPLITTVKCFVAPPVPGFRVGDKLEKFLSIKKFIVDFSSEIHF